jgi:Flp pilus assembly protein CpaB
MTYSVRNIVIALALAAVAGILVVLYTGNVQKQATQNQSMVTVLVAKSEIGPGVQVKDAIAAGDFTTRQVVKSDRVPDALSNVSQLNATLATTSTITAQTQITAGMFKNANENPIVTQLSGLDRAVQISLNSNAVLAGTLQAGDHVDVVSFCTLHPTSNDSKFGDEDIGRVIMTNIPVMSTTGTGAANTSLATDSQAAGASGTLDGTNGQGVILKVSQPLVAPLVYAMHYCGIWMVDRPSTNAQDSPTLLATGCSVFASGLNSSQLKNSLPVCAGKGQ